jgi:hypothetical protein
MDRTIEDYARIKPGTTRGDVEKLFRSAGILETPEIAVYSSRYCTCIRVDVRFKVLDSHGERPSPQDRLGDKSKLYIEGSCLALQKPPGGPGQY